MQTFARAYYIFFMQKKNNVLKRNVTLQQNNYLYKQLTTLIKVMMKQVNIQIPLRMLGLLLGLFLSVGAFAQIEVKGHVKDATGEPIIGATVRVDGTQTATITDFDGNFALTANEGATITVTYIGYQPAMVNAAPTA